MRLHLHRATATALLFFALPATAAAPTLRVQADQRGDFVQIGNTLAQECRVTAGAPVVGTIADCGTDITDGSPDVYWLVDAGTATADVSVQPTQARTHAVLTLPAGAQVTHARLYWTATSALGVDAGIPADPEVSFHLPNGQSQQVQADGSWVETASSTFYQSTADVTAVVQAQGAGRYGVSGVSAVVLANTQTEVPFAGWNLVVFYALASEPQRNLTLFDGLYNVDTLAGAAPITLSGFKVPNGGFSARLGVSAYDGDVTLGGDSLLFNGATVFDAANPQNNFFNSTRSRLGATISQAGDLPQLTGAPGSMGGLDLDEVDVTAHVLSGDSQATVAFTTSGDGYVLGTFVLSVSTLKPDFSSSTKSVTALAPRPGEVVRPGDVLEYTITVTNTGNDEAVAAVVEDPLPAGLTFVSGSLQVSDAAGTNTLTDAAGDDRGEHVAATRLVRVRVGTGASASAGGALPVGASATVTFRAMVAKGASAPVANLAQITAAGDLGTPAFTTKTNGGDAVTLTLGTVPSPVVVTPADQALLATATPAFSGTTESGSQVEVVVEGAVLCTSAPAEASGAWQCSGAVIADGDHAATAVTVDPLGNRSAPTGFSFSTDTVAPPTPEITVPAEAALLNASPAAIVGRAEPEAVVHLTLEGAPLCDATASAKGDWSCPLAAPLEDGAHLASASAEDAAGNVSPSTERSFTLDTVAPDTLILSGPARLEPSLTARFDLDSTEAGVRFECALNTADFSACEDPVELADLAETTHLFRARAVDQAGNADPTPAEHEWTISLRRGQVRAGCGCAGAGPAAFAPLALLGLIAWLRSSSPRRPR